MTSYKKMKSSHSKLSLVHDIRGATLIELLISLAILSIISVAFLNIITSSIGLRQDSDIGKRASALASSEVESIKKADVAPIELIQTKNTADGYQIRTELIPSGSALNLTQAELPQRDTDFYANPVFELLLGDSLTGNFQGTQITPFDLASLTDNQLLLQIKAVEGSTNLLAYELKVNTVTGSRHINIGSQTLTTDRYKPAIIRVTPSLMQNLSLTIEDQVGEHLQVGIFDDELNRIQTSIVGEAPSVKVENGFISNHDSSSLSFSYYDVVVTVTKNGREYARVLTTWAVKQ